MQAYGKTHRARDARADGGPSRHWKNHCKSKRPQRRTSHKRARQTAKADIRLELRHG